MPRKAVASAKRAVRRRIISAGKSGGKYVGGYIAKQLGMNKKTGATIGRRAANQVARQFSRIVGTGDYEMTENLKDYGYQDIMNERTAFTPLVSTEEDGIFIARSEYITDIYSSPTSSGGFSDFQNTVFNINPGLGLGSSGCFSWLPGLAASFQEYDWLQLVFEFRPTVGTAISGTNSSLGTVMLSSNYDATLDPYTDKSEMLNAQYSVSGVSYKQLFFPIECNRKQKRDELLTVRNGPIKPNQNILLYDLANLQIGTVGLQTVNQQLGELYVHYALKLSKFKSAGIPLTTAHLSNPLNEEIDYSDDFPLGNLQKLIPSVNNSMELTLSVIDTTNSYVYFPKYLPIGTQILILHSYTNGDGSTSEPWALVTTLHNAVFLPLCSNNTYDYPQGGLSNQFLFAQMIQITGQGAYINYGNAGNNLPLGGDVDFYYSVVSKNAYKSASP